MEIDPEEAVPGKPTGQRRAAWDQYWSSGALHSCVGSFDGNYGGAIGTLWDAVADHLAPGARVLDLATGNGALPRRLWERRGGEAKLEIDAIDLANVRPAWHDPARHAAIRFHAGVDMCALPFPDDAFDWVLSQFGFEYAPRSAALHEALRVLSSDGALYLVMHHADSVLATVAREELRNQQALLAPGGVLESAEAVVGWIARAAAGEQVAGDPRAESARHAYNMAMRDIDRRIAGSAVPDQLHATRDSVHALLAKRDLRPAAAIEALREHGRALLAASLRTGELLDHALDAPQVEALAAEVGALRPGWRVRASPVSQAEGLLAWVFAAGPAADGLELS
ncbi:class I SAM-dependent methyltransferase [Luteimonas pelagia]